jgi:hypothetical protein
VSPSGPPLATVEVTLVHNAYDNDVDAAIELGGSTSPSTVDGSVALSPVLSYPLPASSAAIAGDWVTGTSTTGNIAWTFAIDIPQGGAAAYLPPDGAHLWRLRVSEGGYLNRAGRVSAYRLIWHSAGGDQVTQGGPLPLQTIEGGTVYAAVPGAVVGVGSPAMAGTLRVGPNPVPGGAAVTFSLASVPQGDLRVYDLAGREVGRAAFMGGRSEWRARWEARDIAGHPLPAGLYFARVGGAGVARVAVLAH